MAKPTASLLTARDMAEVEALARLSPGALLPCRPGFAAASAAAAPLEWYGVRSGDALRAAMALVRRAGTAGISTLQSPLFAPFGSLLLDTDPSTLDGDRRERLLREVFEALDGALHGAADRVDAVMPPGIGDLRGLVWSGWEARPHYNYVSAWDAPGAWQEQVDSSARRQARKARDGGLEVRFASASSTETLCDLWKRNAAKQKLDPSLAANIASIGAWLASQYSGFVAEVRDGDGAAQAAGLYAWDHARVYYLAGASDPEALGSGAPTLLHVAVLEEIDRRELPRRYDWVGANTASVAQFKRKFGPELEILFAARRESRKGRLASAARGLLR